MKRLILLMLPAAAVLALLPSSVMADSATHTYELHMEGPNFGAAPNGDQIEVDGMVDFSVNPKSATGSGTFTHTDSSGTVLATGTWTANDLIDYQSYGCGIVFDREIPPNFCGGEVKLDVTLTTPIGQLSGIMTVICIIGPNPPDSAFSTHSEGVQLVVPGVINFNHSAGGDNIIIQTS